MHSELVARDGDLEGFHARRLLVDGHLAPFLRPEAAALSFHRVAKVPAANEAAARLEDELFPVGVARPDRPRHAARLPLLRLFRHLFFGPSANVSRPLISLSDLLAFLFLPRLQNLACRPLVAVLHNLGCRLSLALGQSLCCRLLLALSRCSIGRLALGTARQISLNGQLVILEK